MYDVCVICVYVQTYSIACIWQLKDNCVSVVFYLHYVISRNGTQVIRFGGKCLHPIGHLSGPHLQTLPRDNHLQQPVDSLVFICPSLPLDSLLFPYRHSFVHAIWKHPSYFLFLSNPPMVSQNTDFFTPIEGFHTYLHICTKFDTTPIDTVISRACSLPLPASARLVYSLRFIINFKHCSVLTRSVRQFISESNMNAQGQEYRLKLPKYYILTSRWFYSYRTK